MDELVRDELVARLTHLRARLGPVADRCVVVGASCAALFPRGPIPIRETGDIDLLVRASGYVEWQAELERFRASGFAEDPTSTAICRLVGHDLVVDLMPVPWETLGFNRWYADGWRDREPDAATGLFRLSPVYFLATKLEAFKDRGRGDPMSSDDLADIVIFLRNRTIPADELATRHEVVYRAVREELRGLAALELRAYAVSGHFEGTTAAQEEAGALITWMSRLPR